jgi:hypothetical protein
LTFLGLHGGISQEIKKSSFQNWTDLYVMIAAILYSHEHISVTEGKKDITLIVRQETFSV